MPDGVTHKAAGGIAGGTYAAFQSAEQALMAQLLETAGGAIAGAFAGRLPDILEPAHTPRHRGICHSISITAGLIVVARDQLSDWQKTVRGWADSLAAKRAALPAGSLESVFLSIAEGLCRMLAGALAGFLAGYISHIALDATLGSFGIRLAF